VCGDLALVECYHLGKSCGTGEGVCAQKGRVVAEVA